MFINGVKHEVVNVIKVGPCVLHIISPPLPNALDSYTGLTVQGCVDPSRRAQLRNHHTACHIIYASCRNVLGPHVWQQGAKKAVDKAHLDITHFKSLTHEQVKAIEKYANGIVSSGKDINKSFMAKDEAEKQYGFHLYQGGVVPGNELRVVNIEETDTEACCGTHCDNTAEVGLIRILKTGRISDGILRLYFVAGEKALNKISDESEILHELCTSWDVSQNDLVDTASRFFEGYKRFGVQITKKDAQILDLQMKTLFLSDIKNIVIRSDQETATQYISLLPQHAGKIKESKKGVVAIGDTFIVALLGDNTFDVEKLKAFLSRLDEENTKKEAEKGDSGNKKMKKFELQVKTNIQLKNGKNKETIDNIYYILSFSNPNANLVYSFFQNELGFIAMD